MPLPLRLLLLTSLALSGRAAPPDLAVPPAEALRTPSGLAYRILQAGQGPAPAAGSFVKAHLTGWGADGKPFAQTRSQDFPPYFPLDRLMPGLRESFLAMRPGEQRRVWIPEALAFAGAKGRPAGPVVVDLELLDSVPPPDQAPEDVAAPPADARLLPSGVAFKVLRPGTGTVHPTRASWVSVHYSGWTADGKAFDSSLPKGAPALLRLSQTIEGWVEGLQLMTVGERRRFWIPEKRAYKGQKGMPAGMLVFEVELLGIS